MVAQIGTIKGHIGLHDFFFPLYTEASNRLKVQADCYRQITTGHSTRDSPASCSTSKRLSAVTRFSPAVSTRRLCRSRSSFFHMTVFSPTSRTTHVMSASSPSYTCTGRGRVSLILGTPAVNIKTLWLKDLKSTGKRHFFIHDY